MAEVRSVGRIVRVAGPVVDVEFAPDDLPEILHALEVDLEVAGEKKTVKAETAQHLGRNTVRAIAMAPTDPNVEGAKALIEAAKRSAPTAYKSEKAIAEEAAAAKAAAEKEAKAKADAEKANAAKAKKGR